MGTHPYGRLGGTKAYRGDIIVHSDEYFKMLSQLHVKNGENAPVRDGLGILHFCSPTMLRFSPQFCPSGHSCHVVRHDSK